MPATQDTYTIRARWRREERELRDKQMVEDCQVVKHALRSVGFRAKVSPARKPPPYHIDDFVHEGVRVEMLND